MERLGVGLLSESKVSESVRIQLKFCFFKRDNSENNQSLFCKFEILVSSHREE